MPFIERHILISELFKLGKKCALGPMKYVISKRNSPSDETDSWLWFLSFFSFFFTMVLKELYHLGGKIKPHPILNKCRDLCLLNPRTISKTPSGSVVLISTVPHREILHSGALRTLEKGSHPCGQDLGAAHQALHRQRSMSTNRCQEIS